MAEFKDYPVEKLAEKLKQVEEFEAKFGENTSTRAWRKFCTDLEYRKREWQFRQNVAAAVRSDIDYRNVN